MCRYHQACSGSQRGWQQADLDKLEKKVGKKEEKKPQKCAIPYGDDPQLRLKLSLPVQGGNPPYPIQTSRSPHKVCEKQYGLWDTRRWFSPQFTMGGKADLVLGIVFWERYRVITESLGESSGNGKRFRKLDPHGKAKWTEVSSNLQ